MKKLNICLISPLPPPYGGIAHWTSMILRHAANRPDIDILSLNTAPRWRSIHNNSLILRAVGGGLQLLRDVCGLVSILSKRKTDAIHLTTSGHLAVVRDLVIAYLARVFGVPLIYHIRFGRVPQLAELNAMEWRAMYMVMRRSSSVVVIDKATYLAVSLFAPGIRVELIPNCVDVEALLANRSVGEKEAKLALFLGWVVPTKGISELVNAWSLVRPRGWRLEIVGPSESSYVEELLERFAPTAELEFVGELSHDEAMKRLANCDLFVFPSHTEGFPNAVVEAMALGRPILATDVGAIPEMLEGGAGCVVKSQNVEQLTTALTTLLADTELRCALGQQAAIKARHLYALDAVFADYMNTWTRVSFGNGND